LNVEQDEFEELHQDKRRGDVHKDRAKFEQVKRKSYLLRGLRRLPEGKSAPCILPDARNERFRVQRQLTAAGLARMHRLRSGTEMQVPKKFRSVLKQARGFVKHKIMPWTTKKAPIQKGVDVVSSQVQSQLPHWLAKYKRDGSMPKVYAYFDDLKCPEGFSKKIFDKFIRELKIKEEKHNERLRDEITKTIPNAKNPGPSDIDFNVFNVCFASVIFYIFTRIATWNCDFSLYFLLFPQLNILKKVYWSFPATLLAAYVLTQLPVGYAAGFMMAVSMLLAKHLPPYFGAVFVSPLLEECAKVNDPMLTLYLLLLIEAFPCLIRKEQRSFGVFKIFLHSVLSICTMNCLPLGIFLHALYNHYAHSYSNDWYAVGVFARFLQTPDNCPNRSVKGLSSAEIVSVDGQVYCSECCRELHVGPNGFEHADKLDELIKNDRKMSRETIKRLKKGKTDLDKCLGENAWKIEEATAEFIKKNAPKGSKPVDLKPSKKEEQRLKDKEAAHESPVLDIKRTNKSKDDGGDDAPKPKGIKLPHDPRGDWEIYEDDDHAFDDFEIKDGRLALDGTHPTKDQFKELAKLCSFGEFQSVSYTTRRITQEVRTIDDRGVKAVQQPYVAGRAKFERRIGFFRTLLLHFASLVQFLSVGFLFQDFCFEHSVAKLQKRVVIYFLPHAVTIACKNISWNADRKSAWANLSAYLNRLPDFPIADADALAFKQGSELVARVCVPSLNFISQLQEVTPRSAAQQRSRYKKDEVVRKSLVGPRPMQWGTVLLRLACLVLTVICQIVFLVLLRGSIPTDQSIIVSFLLVPSGAWLLCP